MNNTYIKVLTIILRALFVWISGFLVSHLTKTGWNVANDIIMALGGPEAIIAAAVAFLGALGWGVWIKLQDHVLLKQAMKMKGGATIAQVKSAAPNAFTALSKPNINA